MTSREDHEIMRDLDEIYTALPFYGQRKLLRALRKKGWKVGRKRVRRLMEIMGIEAVVPKPSLSKPAPGHKIYPYLLRHLEISEIDQVWCADITYLPMEKGHVYLVAIMDWKILLYSYETIGELCQHVDDWMNFYNHERMHQHLDYQTPWSHYQKSKIQEEAA